MITITNPYRLRTVARHYAERSEQIELTTDTVMALLELAFAAKDGDYAALASALELFDWRDV